MSKRLYALVVPVVVFLLLSLGARADVIFDTLGQPLYASDGVGQSGLNYPALAQGFGISSDRDYFLQNVVIGLNEVAGSGVSGGASADFTVSVYDNHGTDQNTGLLGAPGNLLTTLAGNSDPYAAGQYTYVPSGPFVLQAHKIYYIVSSSTSALGEYYWDLSSGTAPEATDHSGALYPGQGWYLSGPSDPQLMQVNADPVPEPGTMALLLMGLPMAGLLWRRRK